MKSPLPLRSSIPSVPLSPKKSSEYQRPLVPLPSRSSSLSSLSPTRSLRIQFGESGVGVSLLVIQPSPLRLFLLVPTLPRAPLHPEYRERDGGRWGGGTVPLRKNPPLATYRFKSGFKYPECTFLKGATWSLRV